MFVLYMVSVRSLARMIREGNPTPALYIHYYADIIGLCTYILYLFTFVPGRGGTHVAFNRMYYQDYYQRVVQVQ